MKTLSFTFLLLLSSASFSQGKLEIHVGGLAGNFLYKDLHQFADSYNTFYANDPDLTTPLKMKTLATGLQVGIASGVGNSFNFGVDIASLKTGVSKAEWAAGFNRGFQLKTFLFELDAGFFITPASSDLRFSIGLGMTLQSTQIESFLEYNKERSYGSESTLNGVWSSWKGYTPLVFKLYYGNPDSNWKIYSTLRLPIQQKKVNSVGYVYSSGFTTEGAAFPADFAGSWGLDNRLSENFRFLTFGIGMAYTLGN